LVGFHDAEHLRINNFSAVVVLVANLHLHSIV
jgi:hypothetical protein